MFMINKCVLIGNIGQELELKYTQSGQAVCNMRIATSEKYTDKQGNKQDKAEWHNVVLFGSNAENASKYLNKGSQVYIDGKIQTRKWTGKDGSDHYTTEIIANEIRFLDSKGDSKPSNQSANKQSNADFVRSEMAARAQSKAVTQIQSDPSASYNQPATITEEQLPF